MVRSISVNLNRRDTGSQHGSPATCHQQVGQDVCTGAPAEEQLSEEERKQQNDKRRKYEKWALLVSTGVFSDLTPTQGGCDILETERRAINLDQLQLINAHMVQRLANGPAWMVSRYDAATAELKKQPLSVPEEVSLYDLNEHVLLPFTSIKRCSMVEMVASESQRPDYFVSHVSMAVPIV